MEGNGPSKTSGEVVYGTGSPTGEENRSMSDKVQNMASSIYREFEFMIQKHGEDGVKNLMPLVVNVLETLDMTFLERDEHAADIEILKEDNEQLLTMFEREKSARRQAEQKYMEVEDNMVGEKRELENKIDSLESVMRMLELKAKNATDHSTRLEEREADQKAEFDRLHERYNTLLRTHVDHMERTKYLMGNDKFELMQNMPIPQTQLRARGGGMAASVDASGLRGVSDLISAHMTQSTTMDVNLANHITEDWQDEFPSDVEPSPRDIVEQQPPAAVIKQTSSKKESTDDESRERGQGDGFDVAAEQSEAEDVLGADLTGNLVDPAEFASADEDDFLAAIGRRSRTISQESDDLGMGREVENLIKENTELLDMKNALNIVKNDLIARVDELSSENEILRDEVRSLEMVRVKMGESIERLEDELKTVRQRLSEKEAENEEEDVPMAQRKRFTRSEMQRVLIDRNTYKEKLMELEESLKWTEMQRARKLQQQQAPTPKKAAGIWDFFSGLFGESPSSPPNPRRAGSRAADGRTKQMTRSVEYIDPDMISERRAAERREQYKLVREHVKRDDSGRIEAYGWSLPVIESSPSQPMVPVPVCCRPLMDNQPTLKVWCATGVTLRGGKTADGAYIVGEPVYFSPCAKKVPKGSVGSEDQLETHITRARALDARESELSEWESSSLVWVGSSNQGKSLVAVLDANNPNNIIDTFDACDSHLLCMHGVPGVMESDPMVDEVIAKRFLSGGGKMKEVPEGMDCVEELGACQWVELRKMEDSDDGVPTYCSNDQKPSPKRTRDFSVCETAAVPGTSEDKQAKKKNATPLASVVEVALEACESATCQPAGANEVALVAPAPIPPTVAIIPLEKLKDLPAADLSAAVGAGGAGAGARIGRAALPPHIRDAMSKYDGVAGQMNSALPTVWMGSQNQYIYIHSAVTAWKQCLRRIKLPDAVLSIVHYKSRVYAALANGTLAVFHRDKSGEWSDAGYHSIRVGKATSSVRSLCVVAGNIWAAYKNCIVVLDAENLQIVKVFAAHPRKDSQVRNMQWIGAGVWISIRLDSSLRLFHAHTFEHLQDVDIEPYVTKMLGTSRLDFSYMRTTSLLVSNRRLWIGTGTGVVISVPLSDTLEQKVETTDVKRPSGGPGGLVRVYGGKTEEGKKSIRSGDYIPYCNLTQAQLSFHGHKDSVKFFLAVPGAPSSDNADEAELRKMLVMSGGDGYIDFRMGEEAPSEEKTAGQKERPRTRDMSHLIIWEVDADLPVLSSSSS